MNTKTKTCCSKNSLHKSMLIGTAGAFFAAQLANADDSWFGKPGVQHVGNVFVIMLENHNFTQPTPLSSPQQILGNVAAPYINSLITPGNPNAAQVSYSTAYFNAGIGVHPSEPNYVWAEAGSDFGFHSDADPNPISGNTFYYDSPELISQLNGSSGGSVMSLVFWHRNQTPHLTRQLNEAGIPWKNYQEDVQLSLSPTNSASGTNGPVNAFNGSTQYNYAVKHNPAGLFGDTALENVYPLAQLFLDLSNNAAGRFNWITPDQYNEAHSSLNGGFTYQGVHYTGDQAAVAEADNFLSIVLPEIMASKAYRDNGVIVLWWDETEGADTGGYSIPEIIISPLAKGNAYASSVSLTHSSDLKTWEEVFGLPLANNPIPANETNFDGTFNNVATANDLSDMFVPEAIPASANLSVTEGGLIADPAGNYVRQTVHITNNGNTPVVGPIFLALDGLTTGVTLANSEGGTQVLAPLGSPYVSVRGGFGEGILQPHQSSTVELQFIDPAAAAISYTARVLNVTPAP
jgi:phosphatidylinositol-3-phosphatase